MDEQVLVCFGDSNTHGSPPSTGEPAPRYGPGRAVARRAGRGARAVVAGARGGPAGADDGAPGPGRGWAPVRAGRAAGGARHALPDRRARDHAGHERPQGPLRRGPRRHRRRPSSGWCTPDARSARRRDGRCPGSCSSHRRRSSRWARSGRCSSAARRSPAGWGRCCGRRRTGSGSTSWTRVRTSARARWTGSTSTRTPTGRWARRSRRRCGDATAAAARSAQASICFFSFSACVISILRGLACSAMGIRRVRTPAS